MEGVLYYQQLRVADEAADLQHDLIRQQQVQLRLQQNQNELVRTKKLQQTLASQQVATGVRNISGASGTVRAIAEESIQGFIQDQNADRLNFMAKQQSLNIEDSMVDVRKRAAKINATAGFLKEIENAVVTVSTAGMGGSRMGGSGGAMAGGGSLMDYGSNMNLNR